MTQPEMSPSGAAVPNLVFTAPNGQQIALAQYRNRSHVVLYLMRAFA